MAAVPEPTTPTPSMAAESPLPPPPDGAPRLYRQASANAACRFCFGGEEGGQLFQPCLCNGSQKYVHVTCLHQWRKTSSNASMRCPTCQYQYNIKHLNMSAWLQHKAVVPLLTLFICGFVWGAFTFAAWYLEGSIDGVGWWEMVSQDRLGEAAMFGLIGLAAFGIIMTIVKIVRQQGRACPRCAGCPEAVRTISCQGNQIAVMIAVAIVVIFGIVQSIRFVWQFAFDLAHHARDAATEYVLDIRDTDARRQAATE